MDAQQILPYYARPPPFSPLSRPTSFDTMKPDVMEIENNGERSQRAASVLSGLSQDDLDAAEALKSLQQDIHSPRMQQVPPKHVHVETTSSFNGHEQEPLLSLITSQYPLAASVIHGGLSMYKTAQKITPGGEWTERNVGLPLARTTARISGVESVARWALQPKKESRNGQPFTPDVEKAYLELTPDGVLHPADPSREPLPRYSAGDQSPPYSEQQVVLSRERQAGTGWRQQLVITTSGLGVAMSEESRRSLKYCLQLLQWANGRLGGAVQTLKELLSQWERRSLQDSQSRSVRELTSDGTSDSALAARIESIKGEITSVLKQVVNVVSTYAGGALPENARRLVRQHLVTLPQRFTIANRRNSDEETNDAATNDANRALVLAQEGLDMMKQVSRVVNDTLVSAEDWVEKLGRGRRQLGSSSQQQSMPQGLSDEKVDVRNGNESVDAGAADGDVKMEM